MIQLDGYRIPLDPSLPLVASQAFTSGEHMFRPGDPVDWRALGASEIDVVIWWRYGLVDHPHELAPESLDAPAESRTVTFVAKPGERVIVETPAQREARRAGKRR